MHLNSPSNNVIMTVGLFLSLGLGLGPVMGCSGPGTSYDPYPYNSRPYDSRYPYDPRYPRPIYREYGPWDMPQPSHPGPPTWFGCPQGSRACYPD